MEEITRQTFDKLYQIKSIMEETQSHRRPTQFQKRISTSGDQRRSGHKVGIFCMEMNTRWLEVVLTSNLFNDQVKEIKCIIIKDKKNIKKEASKYTFCICLCNRRNWTNILSPPWREPVEILLGSRPPISNLDTPDQGKSLSPPMSYPGYTQEKPPNKVEYAPSSSNPVPPKIEPFQRDVVGIFSRSSNEDYSWLVEQLASEYFRDQIQEVKPCYITNNGFQQFMNDLSQCTFGILYHTKNRGRINITDVTSSLYDEELIYLNSVLGKDNVVVLIDDLQDSSDQEKTRILENQPHIGKLASDLLLISHTEKADIIQLAKKLKSIKHLCIPSEYCSRAEAIQGTFGTLNTISAPAFSIIGVFSRSEKSKFDWLDRLMSSKEFGNHQVIFHQISPGNKKGFQSLVSHCKFGILYHCMDRGYQPLTDHKDSLYDEELRYLSTRIGKSRVIVVMDKVGNSDEDAKSWYLEYQPSLGMLARDLLLFTKSEKSLHQKRNRSMHVDRGLSTVYEKLNSLKEILKEGMTSTSFSNFKEDLV